MRAVRFGVLAAGLLIGLAVPAVASAGDNNGPISCSDMNGCAAQCQQQIGSPSVRLENCVSNADGWYCTACEDNSEQ
ncbi:hypothetical protein ACIP5Y_43975 [Nocardia sp. NPDC088792]|uniref:hypothetical protein n=1 Tax=Nocardia sp. NPDC088792 TaxID=3364332 RepID=UPI00382A9E53